MTNKTLDYYLDGDELVIPTIKETLSIKIEQKLSGGVYLAKDRVYSLYSNKGYFTYIKKGDIEFAENMLTEAKLLTKNKLFHPDTKWGIYKLLPDDCNLFSIYSNMPYLNDVKIYLEDEELKEIVNERIGHLCARWQGVLPLSDALLKRNWGEDKGVLYMIDIDILNDISLDMFKKFQA